MGRQVQRLSARAVATASKPGRHADGDGLYLVVDTSGAKRWLFMFRWRGKLKEMGLGGLSSVPLAEARQRAAAARRAVAAGVNPIEQRRAERMNRAEAATFGEFADQLVAQISVGFRSAAYRAEWQLGLRHHAASLRPKSLNEICTDDVLQVLVPLWEGKRETAARLRGKIERVLDAAKAKGLRTGENPARWRGHLDSLLPKRGKFRPHHAALSYEDVPAFVDALRARSAISAVALEFVILTASRAGEVVHMTWAEIDTASRVWTVPAARMKAGREHRVPLSESALEILRRLEPARSDGRDHVFPGQRRGCPLSSMTFRMLLRRMKVESITVHGFRSSFRDWAGECTSFPREIAEAALAHTVGDETERAYRRGDALEKRRQLMEAWAGFLSAPKATSTVVPIRSQEGELVSNARG